MLENGARSCFNKFDCRLFISKFSQFTFCLSISLSVISKRLTQLFCKCCIHSVSVVLNVRFVTNGMYVKNNTHRYVSQTSRNRMSMTWDLYCCLLPQCEALHTCPLGFPITTKWCCDQDVKWCHVQLSQKNVRQMRSTAKRNERCCNLSADVALKMQFTTNAVCAKSNAQIYVT